MDISKFNLSIVANLSCGAFSNRKSDRSAADMEGVLSIVNTIEHHCSLKRLLTHRNHTESYIKSSIGCPIAFQFSLKILTTWNFRANLMCSKFPLLLIFIDPASKLIGQSIMQACQNSFNIQAMSLLKPLVSFLTFTGAAFGNYLDVILPMYVNLS